MPASGMLSCVALVRTVTLEERITSIIRAAFFGCWSLLTLLLARRVFSPWCCRWYVLPKRRFWQQPHGVTSQKTALFRVNAVKTSNFKWDIFDSLNITQIPNVLFSAFYFVCVLPPECDLYWVWFMYAALLWRWSPGRGTSYIDWAQTDWRFIWELTDNPVSETSV
jgi:hypothetical protein